jgi:hypothetical protein
MSQQDLFENQVLEELLRERTNAYHIQNKKLDFWILINPQFINDFEFLRKLKLTNFFNQKKNNLVAYNETKLFYGIILSLNEEFITWLSLRLGYFENIDMIKESQSYYVSNGIIGKFENTGKKININSYFKFSKNSLHPSFLIDKYQHLLASFQFIN